MKITILHAEVSASAGNDEQDVLVQVEAIRRSLFELGHETSLMPATLDLRKLRADLESRRPDLAFNLVESLDGTGRFLHFAPVLLEYLGIPFTGAGSDSLYLTTDKIRTKERLRSEGIATPDWVSGEGRTLPDLPIDPPYIIKPILEDASVGVDDASIVRTGGSLPEAFREKSDRLGCCFVEQFIEGREFNVSLLEGKDGPEVLPAAEILFVDFPEHKPRIVGYEAKWDTGSFEYDNTPRTFDRPACDAHLVEQMGIISRRCWDIFDLRGYARVDFRVDRNSKPWVIEINANPCISPDAGFPAAVEQAGLSYTRMIERILEGAFRP